jgi:di/tricarboxylate transporter
MTTGVLLVFGLIAAALVLFVTELIPNDMTAIGVIVVLVVLQPWTGIQPRDALSGFSSTATITIIAMYMLSAGIQQTGLVQRLGVYLDRFSAGKEWRSLAATVGSTGPLAGFINNTPIVAVFIPMITDLADRVNISPSRLLMPLSFAAILGGTLTLVGTSTNLLASEMAARLIPGRGPIGMFEFTHVGVIIFLVGAAYLMTLGRWLTPSRIPPSQDLTHEFDLQKRLRVLRVGADSSLVGQRTDEFDDEQDPDIELLQLIRDGEAVQAPFSNRDMEEGDLLTVLGTPDRIETFSDAYGLIKTRKRIDEEQFGPDAETVLAKFVVPDGSSFIGETVQETDLEDHHRSTVLAIRNREELLRKEIDEEVLEAGDTLLVQMPASAVDYFQESNDLTLIHESDDSEPGGTEEEPDELDPKTPITVTIMIAVIGLAAAGLLPIYIAALGGVVAMVTTGCLTGPDAYRSVSWNIIFLLAGVIPLGLALQNTGGDGVIAQLIVSIGSVLPVVGVLFAVYLITGLLANVITPVATVVLMGPVAVDAAMRLGGEPFSFLLAVMFASATSFMTPIGYQTNLMIYVPGGYTFGDFLKVGGPLQLLLSIVTTAAIWGF